MVPPNETQIKIGKMLKSFNVSNEQELENKLTTDFEIVKCRNCGDEYSLFYCHYTLVGNPVCSHCGY